METKEVRAAEGLGEDVHDVVLTAYSKYSNITEGNVVPDRVELNSDVFYFRVEDVVLCQACRSVIVTMDGGAPAARKGKAIQQLTKEDAFA